MTRDSNKIGFEIECLDHVAIRVRDMDKSKQWYEDVLGLTSYQKEEWGAIPIFILAGTTGIALFPADKNKEVQDSDSKHVKIDHFAFRISNRDFEKAKEHYEALNVKYHFQDHIYFHSIYTSDPDGHTVELTTLVVEEDSFYKK